MSAITLLWNSDFVVKLVLFWLLAFIALRILTRQRLRLRSLVNRIVALSLLLGALALVGTQIYLITRALGEQGPVEVSDAKDAVTVYYAADRQYLWLPGNCTQLNWLVEGHIIGVYLNGQGKIGEDNTIACPISDDLLPTMTVKFADGTERQYRLPMPVLITSHFFVPLGLALLLMIVALFLWQRPVAQRLAARFQPWFRLPPINDEQLPVQRRLARWMSYGLIGISALFIIANLINLLIISEPIWLTLTGIVGALLVINAALDKRLINAVSDLMQSRFMVFGPVMWLTACGLILDLMYKYYASAYFLSSVQTYAATIFFWLGLFWFAGYALRTFTFDRERRFAWWSLTSLAMIIGLLSLPLPFLLPQATEGKLVDYHFSPILTIVAQFNGDVTTYTTSTRIYPLLWRAAGTENRPTYYMFTSQLCRVANIARFGYSENQVSCGDDFSGVVAEWGTNFLILMLAALIIYEVVRHFSARHYVGWLAAVLVVTSAYAFWYVPDPGTDFSETLMFMVSLWLLYRLFETEARTPWPRIVAYGLMIGLLLLLKIQVIYIIFGLGLCVFLRRWRQVLAFSVVPGLLLVMYAKLIPLYGVVYQVDQVSASWPTISWIWNKFIHFTPFEMAKSLSTTFGLTSSQAALFFGLLLIVGVTVALLDPRFPRRVVLLGWWMFLCINAFVFVFAYSYFSHVQGLMPFIYGAVAQGVYWAQEAINKRLAERPKLARYLCLAVFALPVLHNIIQWAFMNYPAYTNVPIQ